MIYTVEIMFKSDPTFEQCNISAQSVKDAKRRALTKAREIGYRASVAKITAKRQS